MGQPGARLYLSNLPDFTGDVPEICFPESGENPKYAEFLSRQYEAYLSILCYSLIRAIILYIIIYIGPTTSS